MFIESPACISPSCVTERFSTSSADIKEHFAYHPQTRLCEPEIEHLATLLDPDVFVCVIVAGTLLKITTVKLAILCPSLVIQNMGNSCFLWSTAYCTCPVLALISQATATVILPLMLLCVF